MGPRCDSSPLIVVRFKPFRLVLYSDLYVHGQQLVDTHLKRVFSTTFVSTAGRLGRKREVVSADK